MEPRYTKVQDALQDVTLNIYQNDLKACRKCKKLIPLEVKIVFFGWNHKRKRPIYAIEYDRHNRLDCDSGKGERSTPVTYHKECWKEEVMNEQ
jgi:hypothetical protein